MKRPKVMKNLAAFVARKLKKAGAAAKEREKRIISLQENTKSRRKMQNDFNKLSEYLRKESFVESEEKSGRKSKQREKINRIGR